MSLKRFANPRFIMYQILPATFAFGVGFAATYGAIALVAPQVIQTAPPAAYTICAGAGIAVVVAMYWLASKINADYNK